jgi:hypothetical protein
MFIENKYKTWHDNIITKAKNRTLICYKEVHHILPKSLGGSNDKSNLVELTAREHYIVHMLLCKFTTGKEKHKMLYSYHAMKYIKSKDRDYKINSRIAQKLRSQLRHSKKTKLKMSNAQIGNNKAVGNRNNLGRKFSKETKLKMSKARIGNKNALGLRHSEEFKEKITNKHKGNKYCVGKRYLNKDGKNLVVNKSEVDKYLKQGYKLGMDRILL